MLNSPFRDMRLTDLPLDEIKIVANSLRQFRYFIDRYFLVQDRIDERTFIASPVFEPLRAYIVEFIGRAAKLRGKRAEGYIILQPEEQYYDDRHAQDTYDLMRIAHDRAFSSDIKSHQLMFSDSQYYTDGDKAHEDAHEKEDGFRLRLEHSRYSRSRCSTYSY